MSPSLAARIAGISGFLAVALGAFGAHLLRERLPSEMLTVWQTAVLYHLVHSVVLLCLASRAEVSRWSFGLFTAGIVIFSGSLYLYAVTGVKTFAHLTPIGGACLLGGWGVVACCCRLR